MNCCGGISRHRDTCAVPKLIAANNRIAELEAELKIAYEKARRTIAEKLVQASQTAAPIVPYNPWLSKVNEGLEELRRLGQSQ